MPDLVTPRGIICQYHGYQVASAGAPTCPACERVRATRPRRMPPEGWYVAEEPVAAKPAKAVPNETHRCPAFEREYGELR